MINRVVLGFANRLLTAFADRIARQSAREMRTSPQSKVAQRHLFNYYRNLATRGTYIPLQETGYRVFSQFEEDGKLLYIFAAMGIARGSFVDIGAGDGINSNCANLALNFGWTGVFVDGSIKCSESGRAFYDSHPDSWAYPPKFVQAIVNSENINNILRSSGTSPEPELMSIDIDGNDYWVWNAIDCITPKVVIIETQVAFGMRNIVVPYNKDYRYPGDHPDYFGASPFAMAKLANQKGYRLVGANQYGFNAIYVRRGWAEGVLPEVTVESLLAHPRNAEKADLFRSISDREYVVV